MNKSLKAVLWTVGVLAVIAAILRFTFFMPWKVPDDPFVGAAIAPSLREGDTVILLTRGKPGFGDLVRCLDPQDPMRHVIGRIAGMPGDRLDLEGAGFSVNGTRYDVESVCVNRTFKVLHPTSGQLVDYECGTVKVGGGWHFIGRSTSGPKQPKKTVLVPEGMYYLLSDNRDLHDDSRDYGSVAAESCKERVVFRLWSKAGWGDSEARLSFIR